MLVSNNPYGSGRMLDLGRRARLAQGTLGVIAARLASTGRAVGLLRRAQYRSVTRCTAPGEVIIQADTPTVPVGIDGEAVTVCTPVHCTIRPPRPAGPAAVYPAGCPATAAADRLGPPLADRVRTLGAGQLRSAVVVRRRGSPGIVSRSGRRRESVGGGCGSVKSTPMSHRHQRARTPGSGRPRVRCRHSIHR